MHLEIDPLGCHVHGQLIQPSGPGPKGAAVPVDRLQRSRGGGDPDSDRLTFNGTVIETGSDSYRLAHTVAQL